jgi:hypothetical protein
MKIKQKRRNDTFLVVFVSLAVLGMAGPRLTMPYQINFLQPYFVKKPPFQDFVSINFEFSKKLSRKMSLTLCP